MKRIVILGLSALFMGVSVDAAYAAFFQHTHARNKHHHAHVYKIKSVGEAAGTVNLNSADTKLLSSLKGIGIKKAQLIVAYREKSGLFKSISDLAGVKGIGAKFIARLKKNNLGRLLVK